MLKALGIGTQPFWSAFVMAVGLSLTGCTSSTPPGENTPGTAVNQGDSTATDSKPDVVVSYSVACNMVEAIAQTQVNLKCLIDPAQDPHVYEGKPSDRLAIEKANVVFYAGLGFEPAIVDMVAATNTPAPKIALHEAAVPTENRITVEEDGEVEADPHVWHDVKYGIRMAELIEANLAKVDPANASTYKTNADTLVAKLKKLDAWIPQQIATIPENQRRLVTTHDSMGYFSRAYGLTVEGTLLGVSTEEEPTASQVKSLVNGIKDAKVPMVFAELTANDKVLKTVAREAGVKISDDVLVADGLGEKNTPQGTYIGMMEYNTCAIAQGLGGQCTPFTP